MGEWHPWWHVVRVAAWHACSQPGASGMLPPVCGPVCVMELRSCACTQREAHGGVPGKGLCLAASSKAVVFAAGAVQMPFMWLRQVCAAVSSCSQSDSQAVAECGCSCLLLPAASAVSGLTWYPGIPLGCGLLQG